MKIGFDNEKYINLQSKEIAKRINAFGNKLYLEFGGKLFNDFHATRVLPGFKHDSKLRMLLKLKDQAEVMIVISSQDIKNKKIRSDINLTYEEDVFRIIKKFKKYELNVNSVIVSQYENNKEVKSFIHKIEKQNIKVYKQYKIKNYPQDIDNIISENGFGKNEYAKTEKKLIIVTAPGPGSGKLSTIFSQLYFDNKHNIKSGYAKFETFPIWNLKINHPVNLAYEAATIDLNDYNAIDSFHKKSYGIEAVSYNRDLEAFPILNSLFNKIYKTSPYKSPTDMGVNMAGFCIFDDEIVKLAAKKEIIRRYYQTIINYQQDKNPKIYVKRLYKIIKENKINSSLVKSIRVANEYSQEKNIICSAIEINSKTIIIGKESTLLNSNSAMILNTLKYFAKIDKDIDVLDPKAIALAQNLKNELHYNNLALDLKETLFALAISAKSSKNAKLAFEQINKLSGLYVHRTALSSASDKETFKSMDIQLTEQTNEFK
ncbi:DUF1846 family protein [Metamycoplasma phocicerebrale]|uniref:DUF1846 family protein n=1 Tax=Metamycoplasma phocicerebrale TaxID=142649 RepID=A0A3Q9VAF8_9BACT|nr:DUF1846 domain-containing protein [Metamycoplasma phocicerebrale]AZZ65705.1 DUF1846 family protein [Metamycoplasma phocicerebrale]